MSNLRHRNKCFSYNKTKYSQTALSIMVATDHKCLLRTRHVSSPNRDTLEIKNAHLVSKT